MGSAGQRKAPPGWGNPRRSEGWGLEALGGAFSLQIIQCHRFGM
jgi:hypothetical protein